MKKTRIESVNEDFYNEVYKSQNGFISYLKSLISFDQQSKSRINYYFLKRNIPKQINKMSILDYGAGRGSLISKFAGSNQLYACDISQEANQNIKKVSSILRKPISTFHPNDVHEHIKDDSLDLITSSHVLEHVPDDIKIIKLMYEKLAVNGYLFLNLPVNEVWKDPNHIREYSEQSINHLLESHGFTKLKHGKSGHINGWLLKKRNEGGLVKKILPLMKLMYMILPSRVNCWIEFKLLKGMHHTHYLVLAQKQSK